MAILNNLYPPIVDTYAPAFLVDSPSTAKNTCRIYFSISLYNSKSDIQNAQITISDQYTNLSVLNEDLYPCGIALKNINEDTTKDGDDKYYIEITPRDIIGGQFQINQYYKVQIRFTAAAAQTITLDTPQAIDSWLAANLGLFSEWSTICLVRGISTPTLTIPGFETLVEYTTWATPIITVAGKLTFINKEETETLKSYRIKLYSEAGDLLVDTDNIYSNNYVGINEINYTFKYGFVDGETYRMTIDYQTKNLYSDSYEYKFMVVLGTSGKLDATLYSVEDIDNGRIGIRIKGNTVERFTGNITIRRTSSESNFTIWDDIHTLSIENQLLDITWYDSTVKSGVWYRYCAQKRDSLGNRGVITELKNPVMIVLDDMFLTAGGTQVKIEFNPQVSSFKKTVAESKTDTIGSKYPYIKRNGYICYRQFPISGLISHFMDKDKILTSREELYKDTLELFDEYNNDNRITPFNDYTYERDFREVVMDFLYDNNVKLFRSPTEGNILVKLMDINFTPEQTLGRMVYTFSCTAYEIADFTLENCNLYNIQPLGEVDEELAYREEFNGQLQVTVPANRDVLEILQQKYQKLAKEGFICKVEYLDFLRIEMEQPPYLIKEDAGGPYRIDDTAPDWDRYAETAYLGYIAIVNSEPIVINPEGIYELKNEGVRITSLQFPTDTTINLNYHVSVSQTEDKSQLPKTISYSKKVGQCWGSFDYQDSIFQRIFNKYYEKYTTYIQSMLSINGIRVEANPGTVIYVAESKEQEYQRHIIGQTCSLSFEDEDSVIIGLYFSGVHFEEATEAEKERNFLPDFRYIDTGITVTSLNDIKDPVKNGVYILNAPADMTITKVRATNNDIYDDMIVKMYDEKYMNILAKQLKDNKYIWYNDKWWLLTDSHDLLCPVEALVDYNCEIMKGMYAIWE